MSESWQQVYNPKISNKRIWHWMLA